MKNSTRDQELQKNPTRFVKPSYGASVDLYAPYLGADDLNKIDWDV